MATNTNSDDTRPRWIDSRLFGSDDEENAELQAVVQRASERRLNRERARWGAMDTDELIEEARQLIRGTQFSWDQARQLLGLAIDELARRRAGQVS